MDKLGTKAPKPKKDKKLEIKVIEIKPDVTIKKTGSTEGMRDAKKIEGKPHSSPEGRFMSKMRSMPLKVVTLKKGGRAGYSSGGAVLKGKKVGCQIK